MPCQAQQETTIASLQTRVVLQHLHVRLCRTHELRHLSSSPIARGLRGIASVLTGADYAGPLCCALQVPEFSLLVANALLLIGEAAMCSATRRI